MFLAVAQRTKWIPKARTPRHVSVSWGGDLSAFFVIETCERCGGMLKIVAAIEGPEAIAKILEHLGLLLPVKAP